MIFELTIYSLIYLLVSFPATQGYVISFKHHSASVIENTGFLNTL